jgi:L-cysteate sulfo-lyase
MSTDPTSTEPPANEPGTTDRTSTDADERTAAQVIDDARAQLATHPREHLATLPTPLEPCERLSEALGGPGDLDQTRRLHRPGDGRQQGAQAGVPHGPGAGPPEQREWARSGRFSPTTPVRPPAAANALGLGCDLILSEMVPRVDGDYQTNGNQTLFRILGTPVHRVSDDQDTADAISSVEEAAAEAGEIVSWIPTGGSSPVGALATSTPQSNWSSRRRIRDRVPPHRQRHLDRRHLRRAARRHGPAGGRNRGDRLRHLRGRRPLPGRRPHAARCAGADARPRAGARGTVDILDGYCGDGYGIPTAEATEAIELFARTEGILLDPVYSGKAAAGLIDVVRRGLIGDDERVLFLHTGGAPGLFAYSGEFA